MRVFELDDYVANRLNRLHYQFPRRWLPWFAGILLSLAILTVLLSGSASGLAVGLGLLALTLGLVWGYFEWTYRRMGAQRSQLEAGLEGQQIVPQILSILDDRYYLINNLALPGRADDIDHILVGPNGIFALEIKHHRGRIFVRDGQWYQAKLSRNGRLQPENPIRDPIQQIKRNVDYLRTCINHTDPALSRQTRLWIEGAVVFTHRQASLDLPTEIVSDGTFPIFHARDLPAYIIDHRSRRTYSRVEILRILSMLAHLRTPRPRK